MISVRVPAKFMRPITLLRFDTGGYVDGVWIDGTPTQSTIQASVQPLTGNDFRLLPEGDRKLLAWKIFTNIEFSMGNDDGIRADELIIDGVTFRISNKDNFQFFGHSEAVFVEATE